MISISQKKEKIVILSAQITFPFFFLFHEMKKPRIKIENILKSSFPPIFE